MLGICYMVAGCLPPDIKPLPLRDADFQRAEMAFLVGHYQEALRDVDGIVRNDARIELLKGRCFLHTKYYTQAIECFQRAQNMANSLDTYIQSLLGMADAYYSNHEYKKSSALYNQLLHSYPQRIPRDVVSLRYSHSLLRMNRWEEGTDMLDTIENEFPDSSVAHEAQSLRTIANGHFFIQVGLFSSRVNAAKLQRALALEGFSARIEIVKSLYSVIIGYFDSMPSAEKELERLKTAGYPRAFIKP